MWAERLNKVSGVRFQVSGAEYPMLGDGNYRFKVQGSRFKVRDGENIAYIFYLTPYTLYPIPGG